MLISIVTPCHNNAPHLEACIESVLAQDHPEVEHIIQDGASDDGTVDILRSYDGRVDWVSEPDIGQADGLDRALRRCRGDAVLVLNSDDVLLPGACAWAARHMARHPEAAVVYGDIYIVNRFDEIIGAQFGPDPYDYEKVFCLEQVIPAQAAFLSRRHLAQVGLGVDPTIDTCPDYEMMVRIGSRFPMVHEPYFVSKYRWHPHPDSRLPRSAQRFVTSKRKVMRKFYQDPHARAQLRCSLRHAEAGLHQWAAVQAQIDGDIWDCPWQLYLALARQPTMGRAHSVVRTAGGLLQYALARSGAKSEYK